MQFTLNGTDYEIQEGHHGGWFWSSGKQEGRLLLSPIDAQQDAMAHAEAEYNQEELSEANKKAEWEAIHATSNRSL